MTKFRSLRGKSEDFMRPEYIWTAGILVGVVALALALAWWVKPRAG
jgi:hypothetical protein